MLRFLLRLLMLLILGAGSAAAWFFWQVHQPLVFPAASVELDVQPGQNFRQVAREVAQAGIELEPWQFILLARVLGQANAVKAGSYELDSGLNALELLEKLTRGDVTQGEVAIIDGWNWRQVRAALDANADLRHDSKGLSDEQIRAQLGVTEASLEGLFFPDTYLFPKHASDFSVLRRAQRLMQRRLSAEWEGRETNTPCRSPYEALILASIVEKETGLAADRGKVASVFVNRLRIGMPLQTDPTVIYGLGSQFDGNLRKRDLQTDTPYNTYTRKGLPPGPIAMPGRASLRAALHPEASSYLYFVARGDGSSQFSSDLDSHNRAVARYQKRK